MYGGSTYSVRTKLLFASPPHTSAPPCDVRSSGGTLSRSAIPTAGRRPRSSTRLLSWMRFPIGGMFGRKPQWQQQLRLTMAAKRLLAEAPDKFPLSEVQAITNELVRTHP